MRILRTKRFALAFAAVASLAGCVEATLPRFDGGILNPEIRLLRAGEIMECVKCALTSFMNSREIKLMKEREATYFGLPVKAGYNRCPPTKPGEPSPRLCQIEGVYFSPYHLNVSKAVEQSFYPWVDLAARKDKKVAPKKANTKDEPTTEYILCKKDFHLSWELDKEKKLVQRCIPNNCDAQHVHGVGPDDDHRMGATVWDYTVTVGSNSIKEKGCVAVPDYGRFSLDQNNTASMQLTLMGVNSGFVNYQRIDASGVSSFITPGSGATGFPFPMLQISPKATTTFEMTATMPQAIHLFQQPSVASDRIVTSTSLLTEVEQLTILLLEKKGKKTKDLTLPEVLEFIKLAKDQIEIDVCKIKVRDCGNFFPTTKEQARLLAQGWRDVRAQWKDLADEKKDYCWLANKLADSPQEKAQVELACDIFGLQIERIAAQLPDKPEPKKFLANEFYTRCRPDISTLYLDGDTRIDFLALKRVLDNVVERQEEAVHRGIPDLTLNTLILTSAFQITLEAQAGTRHLFRILPLLAPPNTDVKLDHTHTLRVTLNGKKNKDPQSTKRLIDSCRERVSRPLTEKPEDDQCLTEYGQLLEGVIQALEKSGQ